MNHFSHLLAIPCIALTASAFAEEPLREIIAPPAQLSAPAFYKKFTDASGYPIVASGTVNDYALREAAFLTNMMLAKIPKVRDAMIESGSRLCIIAWNEFTTDLPEFSHFKPKDFWDARARGTGGSETDPFCSCGEENLLGYPGDPYSTESILIHEMAHNIHLRGVLRLDPSFDDRLKKTYDAAMTKGLWKGKYASVNDREYFAEGVQSWFDNNREEDHDHNHVNTRAELKEYDPGLAELCREVFGETELKYTRPEARLTGHLSGYDPTSAPKFVWPERLLEQKAKIRADAEARGKAVAGGIEREIRDVSGWKIHINKILLSEANLPATEKALSLLKVQLDEIIRVVPAPAVVELKKVPMYFSPTYPGIRESAEYHPGAEWLKDNGRDPTMGKGVEFTNIAVFEEDTRRMPNFALHELAHAYHDLVLPQGSENAAILAAYGNAKAGGGYARVERTDADGNKRMEVAYAISHPAEYFAESTEAFFVRNDFFPYTRKELEKHDPGMAALIAKLWGVK